MTRLPRVPTPHVPGLGHWRAGASQADRAEAAQTVVRLLSRHGLTVVHGSGVSALQHAWQCARLAARAGVRPSLELAAWLHEMDLLLLAESANNDPPSAAEQAHRWLLEVWGPAVAEPVRLLPAARACWLRVGLGAKTTLTPGLVQRVLGATEAFWPEPWSGSRAREDALWLCRWEQEAQDPNLHPPSLDTALLRLQAVALRLPVYRR